jgi:hypothetical protein
MLLVNGKTMGWRGWRLTHHKRDGGLQVATQSELHQHAQKYCAQLQDYNGKLQSDSQALADSLRTMQVSTLSATGIHYSLRAGKQGAYQMPPAVLY